MPLPLPRMQPHRDLPNIPPTTKRISRQLVLADHHAAHPGVGVADVSRGEAVLEEDLVVGAGAGEGELEAGGGVLEVCISCMLRDGAKTPKKKKQAGEFLERLTIGSRLSKGTRKETLRKGEKAEGGRRVSGVMV